MRFLFELKVEAPRGVGIAIIRRGGNTGYFTRSLSIADSSTAPMSSGAIVAQDVSETAEIIFNDAKFEAPLAYLHDNYDRQIEEPVELIEIPSGPFMEAEISARYA